MSQAKPSETADPTDGAEAAAAEEPMRGRRVFVVEDNPYIALALEEILVEREVIVAAIARTLPEALAAVQALEFDVALLDVNIGGEKTTAVADTLLARGKPFVFATGYGRAGLPERYADHALIEKPFYIEELLTALRDALRASGRAGG
jgi:CheY-like chemotaxis protein